MLHQLANIAAAASGRRNKIYCKNNEMYFFNLQKVLPPSLSRAEKFVEVAFANFLPNRG